MALKIVGSNPTTHPTKKKDFHKKSFFFILGCSQVVRHHTLTVAFRWFESIQPNQTKSTLLGAFCLVGEDGFEPSKSVTTDLQSAPFGRSGILPYINPTEAGSFCGAGGRLRTPDLLITNQLLYLLSYTSLVSTNAILS